MNKIPLFFLLSFGALLLRAETPPDVIFPDDATWTVDITYREKAASDKPRLTRAEVARTGDTSHYRNTWSNGRITEDWLTGKYVFWQDPASAKINCVKKETSLLAYDALDQARFSWVGAGELMGHVKFHGRSCAHVRQQAAAAGVPAVGDQSSLGLEAWIDAETHLPAGLDDGMATYVYSFQAAPSPAVVLPREYQDYLVRYERALSASPSMGTNRPPQVAFPEDAAWTIDITYRQATPAGSAAPPRLTRVEAVRTGSVSHYHDTWSNGRTTDDWLSDKFFFWNDPASGKITCVNKGTSILEYQTLDKSRFSWVSTGEVAAHELFHGKNCVRVEKEIEKAAVPGSKQTVSTMVAWIEVKTNLPAGLDDGSATYVFSFEPPPSDPLVFPKEYQDYLVRYTRALAAPERLGY